MIRATTDPLQALEQENRHLKGVIAKAFVMLARLHPDSDFPRAESYAQVRAILWPIIEAST